MKIQEFIDNINDKIPHLNKYHIFIERIYDIYKLGSDKNISCIRRDATQSELETFKPNFFYYIEENPQINLYTTLLCSDGEVRKIYMGYITLRDGISPYLRINNIKYKRIVKGIKKAIGVIPTKGRTEYSFKLNGDFITEKRKIPKTAKKSEIYKYVFSDDTTIKLLKSDCYIASDISINKNLSIKSVSIECKYTYDYHIEKTFIL